MNCNIIELEFGTPLYDLCLRLRYQILRKPLGLEFTIEQIEKEFSYHHFACLLNSGELIGYLMMVPKSKDIVQMKQVAVDAGYRNLGVGKRLVQYAEKWANSKGFQTIRLHARDTARSFYSKLGYNQIGDSFEEVSILHYTMEKTVS